MGAIGHELSSEDLHIIDLVETLAERRSLDFDRVGDDQIAFSIEGAWRSYSLSLAWSGHDETLRLICTFEMEPDKARLAELYKLLDHVNDKLWCGTFTLWREPGLMVYRYGLVLTGGGSATAGQIDAMMKAAVEACERFYPAFQLVCWGDNPAEKALEIAIAEAYGRA